MSHQQQPFYPYNSSYLSPSSTAPANSHLHLTKPEPMPLQHQTGSSSSSSASSGYRSNGTTSDHSQSPLNNNNNNNNNNGAAALLHQHQANQHAFRTNSSQPYFVYQNQSGPSSSAFDTRPNFDVASRESSASSSTRGSEGSMVKQETEAYDPFRIKHRRRTSPPQLKILEHHFELNPKPDVTTRKALSEQLDMTPREVQVWFQNRRAKVKKLKERADRDAVSSSRDGNSPPDSEYDEKPLNHLSASAAALPIPPNIFPPQPYPSRTIYGQDVISQQRTSPPSTSSSYSPMSYPQAGPSMLPAQPHHLAQSDPSMSHPYGPPGSYQSTVYTTTVASSTFAHNEYHPGSSHSAPPHFPLLAHDPFAGRRYSLPVLGGPNEHSSWSAPTISDPPATSDGFPPCQPPTSSAFASSALNASTVSPGSIDNSQSSSYPTFPSYSFTPSTTSNNTFHDRRASYVSDSLSYDSANSTVPVSSTYDVSNSSSYIPSQLPAPSDPFSSFDPLAPVPLSAPPVLTTASLLEDASMVSPTSGSRLVERRASIAQHHRQSNRLKPYDQNDRRSPSGSHSPLSQ